MPTKRLIADPNMETWALCLGAAALVTAIIYPFIRVILRKFLDILADRKTQEKVRSLRLEPTPSKPPRLVVRQTDLVGAMTAADRERYVQAEDLLKQGQPLQAAAIFEAVKFQRKAVDVLEAAGLIDEAAAVLLRLKVPNRAAILYERNHRLEPAAKLYLEAAEYGNAAKILMQLGQQDFHHYHEAATAFQRVGRIAECLEALAEVQSTEKILALCLSGEHLPFLARYTQGRRLTAEVFARLPADQLAAFCAAAGTTPRAMTLLAGWTECPQAQPALLDILRQACISEELAKHFTASLTQAAHHKLEEHLHQLDLAPKQLTNLQLALRAKTKP